MFILVAGAAKPHFTGEVARKSFATIEEAEKQMAEWARFGVDNLCDEADSLRIFDARGELLKTWNRRLKRAV